MYVECPHCGRSLSDGIPHSLTRSEAIVYKFVVSNPGVSRKAIYQHIYKTRILGGPDSRYTIISVHINKINKKLTDSQITRIDHGYHLIKKEPT